MIEPASPAPADGTLAAFREDLARHRVVPCKELLAAIPPEAHAAVLASPEWLEALLEHQYELVDLRRLRALLWRALASGMPRATSLFHQARLLMLGKRYWHALETLERHPDLVAGSPRVALLEIGTLGNMSRLRSARKKLDALRERIPDWELRYTLARLAWMDDDRPRARALFAEGESEMGHDPNYWVRRLYVSLELGLMEESEAVGRQGLQRFPDSVYLLLATARVLEIEDKKADAAAMLRRSLEISPTSFYAPWLERHVEFLGGWRAPEVLLPVKTLQQRRAFCGPNTLSLLAAYWGREVPQEEIAVGIWDQGTSFLNMWEWARRNGYRAHVFSGSPERVRGLLDRGVPVITERAWARGGHYYVFVGYSARAGELYLRDPDAADVVAYPESEFATLFGAHDAWCMVMVPPERAAALDQVELPHQAERELADRIGDRLYNGDPVALSAELAGADLAAIPNTRDLLLLRLADMTADLAPLEEVGQRLLERNPQSGPILSLVLRAWTGHLPGERLLELARRLLELDRHPGTLSNWVELLVAERQFDEAHRWARRVLEHFPGEASSYLGMANLLLSLDAEERAIELLEIAEEIDSWDPYLLTSLGNALVTVGRCDAAIHLFETAIAVRPGWPWPLFSKASALERAGRHQEAVLAYRANLEATPWYMDNYRQLARLVEDQGDPAEAERVLARGIEAASQPRGLMLDRGYLLHREGRFDEAAFVFEALLAERADDTSARVGLARSRMTAGRWEEAAPLLRQAVAEAPAFAYALHLFCQCLDRLGRHEEEVERLWEWVRKNPLDVQFDVALADNLKLLGREQQLFDHLAAAVEGAAEPAGACCRLVSLLQRYDRWADARPWIERALALSPGEAWGHSLLGDSLWQAQEFDAAAAAYRRALEIWPGYAWAIRRMAGYHLRRYEPEAIEYGRRLVLLDGDALPFLLEIFESLGRDEEAYRFLVREGGAVREQFVVQVHSGLIQARLGRLDRAREHLERAHALAPHNGWTMAHLAELLVRQGETERAEELLARAVEVAPENSWVRRRQVSFLAARGRFESALAVAREGFERDPGDEGLATDLRELFARLGRAEEGAAYLAPFAERIEEPADVWCQVALLWKDADRLDRALEALERATCVAPRAPWAWRLRGLVLSERQDLPGAEAAFRRCLELNPGDPVAWGNLTELHRMRGELQEALVCIERRASLDPDDTRLQEDLYAICAEGGLWSEGERRFAELEARTRWKDHTWLHRARLASQKGDAAGAIAALDRAVETNPTFQDGLLLRAQLHLERGARDAGLADLERLLEINPAHAPALTALLGALDPRSERERGFEALRRALAAEPDEGDLHAQANRWAEITGDPRASLPLLEPLLEVVETPHRLLGYIGTAHFTAGDLAAAEAAFRESLARKPDYHWALARLGDLFRHQGRDAEAVEHWRRAIKSEPQFPWPYEGLDRLYAERGDLDGRWEIQARRLASDPDRAEHQYELQELAVAAGRADAFRDLALSLLARSRAPHELLTRAAHVLFEAGRTDEALDFADRAVQANPRAWWAQSKRADILSRLEREEEALAAYREALALRPDETHSASRIFVLVRKRGEKDEARAALLALMERFPDRKDLFDTWVRELREDDPARAAEELVPLAGRAGAPLFPLLAAAELWKAAGEPKQAVTACEEAARRLPESHRAWVVLADTRLEAGQSDRYLAAVAQGIARARYQCAELLEQAIFAHENGFSLAAADEEEGARELLEAARALAAGRPADAEATCRALLDSAPGRRYARYLLAEALLRQGRHEEALGALRSFMADRREGDVDRAEVMLALALAGSGDAESARAVAGEWFRRADEGQAYWRSGWCELAESLALAALAGRRFRETWSWLGRRRSHAEHSRAGWRFWPRLLWALVAGR